MAVSGSPVSDGRVVRELEELAEAFFGEREEQVVLARKVAVEGRGAVLDLFRDLADRHVPVALGDEQLPGRVQNPCSAAAPGPVPDALLGPSVVPSRVIERASINEQCSLV